MITKSLPNVFTIGNLFLGIIAIISVFNNKPELAAIMVIVAMLLDGLDGRVARALNAQSEFGKELDSLSDVISFGVAPAFIMYVVAFTELNAAAAWIVTAVFPICGALRLARFNVVAGTPGYFIGLPIPAAGGVLCTLALFHQELSTLVLVLSTLLLSYLMVSTVKYPNFKKIGIPKAAIWITPVVVVIAVVLAVKFPGTLSKLIFVPLLLYALYGLKKNVDRAFFFARRKRKKELEEAESRSTGM
ncbi:CDP-diacylglycerol---serine O-phosphatidyltransferase [Paenibacillus sp. UNCCL117]|uniref:CDP-diacylglycerol--serine O-phosphatidyltransferase n=1 Tax=unclassified Paenibacillus TaxID=185978 RepID=UPI00088636A1|nr:MULTISPECIES: CDP-diacylglycerol--serine O-phosphatidyltransferase [unclassified Paenibacillus]SDE59070.1 CDP-diacylglycerol---serine O-phosphatidyltransferase [Paenibacillus sp. cl123]SFW68765.1 CDP-diacylglycerol---serine O-phosphatidyltransferase [Paenibacillus sp. UNCCL117]